MKLHIKKVAAVGISCALFFSPFASLIAKANVGTGSISARLQSLNNLGDYTTSDNESNYSEDTLVIQYSQPLSFREHQRAGGTVFQQVSGLNYVAVKVKNKKNLQQTIQNYRNNKKVLSVNLSPKYQLTSITDPKISKQYIHKLLNTAGAQKLAGKSQVKVAVIDSGIDRNHPDLKGSIIKSTNMMNPMNPTVPYLHGTHVAGIIAAKKGNGIGGYGMDPNAKILSYDVSDGSMYIFDYTIANAISKAVDQGADIINLSLGSPSTSYVLQDAVEKAINKGVVVVAAAGNEASDEPSYPADYEGVISVGSVNSHKKLSSFSSYGASTDLVAPGENIYAPYYDDQKKSTFAYLSGTSMASPAVAGVAALLLSKHPKLKPAEVEYILEKTATDLGEKGFDDKYGNGLINPLAAMKFDVKKIPTFVKQTWGENDILNNAEKISAPAEVNHSFTKPSEQKWVKLHVEKGEYIQATLYGSPQYDYKMSMHFYGDNQKQLTEINDVKAGKAEAKMLQAPFSGTLAIGVKDVNGSYDDSKLKQSTVTLQVDKVSNLPEDESTLEAPIHIDSLPFNQDNLYLTGDTGDEDYFHFTSKEAQLIKVDVTGIPGVDISTSVYEKDQLFPSVNGDGTSGDSADVPSTSTDDQTPLFSSNTGGIGEGETLSFQTEPDKEYYVKITNKSTLSTSSLKDLLLGLSGSQEVKEPAQSLLPYGVKIEGKTIPDDEDGFDSSMYTMSTNQNTTSNTSVTDDSERISLLDSVAIPYDMGGTIQGYLQNPMDQDWYKLNPASGGIYQINIPTPSKNTPAVELYEVDKGEDDTGNSYQYLTLISSNQNNDTMSKSLITGLKANKTYFLAVSPNYNTYQIPYDGYKVTTKLLVKNAGDAYEENDQPEQAKTMPANGVKANFATPGDIDTYYFTSKKSAVYEAQFSRTPLTSTLTSKYSRELLAPIYGYFAITEDLNKNHKMDDKDKECTTVVLNVNETGLNSGSFNAKKGKSYFISVMGFVDSNLQLSLWPYQMQVKSMNNKDEDAGSKVKKNTPSKPMKLKKVKSKQYTAQAYFNAGYQNGDSDWYIYQSKKTKRVKVTLDAGPELDGVIEIYKNGKKVKSSDIYGKGDTEILFLNMTKGTYYIKVRDTKGNASLNPYKLSLELK